MPNPAISSRRDERYRVAPGDGVIEFVGPQRQRALTVPIRTLSISGMSFGIVIDDLDVEPGTQMGCTVRIRSWVLQGNFIVRNRFERGDEVTYGGLFYPNHGEDEHRLMQTIALYEAGSPEQRRVRVARAKGGIFLRCHSCYRACWFEWNPQRHTCVCGRMLDLGASDEARSLELTGDLARQLGQQHDIDLPSAYSILAGLMTLEQAMELGHASSPACRVSPTAADSKSTSRQRYDPAFKEAVAEGLLSPLQAYERGKREKFARKITERHSISLEHAYDVADNRISLLAAVRHARQSESAGSRSFGVREPAPGGLGRTAAVTVFMAVAIATTGWYLSSWTTAPAEGALPDMPPDLQADPVAGLQPDIRSVLRSATRVDRDERGVPTRVVGPDPKSVLLAVCEAISPDNRLEPLDVRASFPPSAGGRLGTLRDVGSNEILVLHLRRDRSSGRWFAGDGASPLTASRPAPAFRGTLGLP